MYILHLQVPLCVSLHIMPEISSVFPSHTCKLETKFWNSVDRFVLFLAAGRHHASLILLNLCFVTGADCSGWLIATRAKAATHEADGDF